MCNCLISYRALRKRWRSFVAKISLRMSVAVSVSCCRLSWIMLAFKKTLLLEGDDSEVKTAGTLTWACWAIIGGDLVVWVDHMSIVYYTVTGTCKCVVQVWLVKLGVILTELLFASFLCLCLAVCPQSRSLLTWGMPCVLCWTWRCCVCCFAWLTWLALGLSCGFMCRLLSLVVGVIS